MGFIRTAMDQQEKTAYSRAHINIKTVSLGIGILIIKNTVVRLYYHYNGNPYTDKMATFIPRPHPARLSISRKTPYRTI